MTTPAPAASPWPDSCPEPTKALARAMYADPDKLVHDWPTEGGGRHRKFAWQNRIEFAETYLGRLRDAGYALVRTDADLATTERVHETAGEAAPLIKALCQLARVTVDAWNDGCEEGADDQGRTAIDSDKAIAVNAAIDALKALVPESEEPFYESYVPEYVEQELFRYAATTDARVIAMREAAAKLRSTIKDNQPWGSHPEWVKAIHAYERAIRALALPDADALSAVIAEAVERTLADEGLLRKTLREMTRAKLMAAGELGGTRHVRVSCDRMVCGARIAQTEPPMEPPLVYCDQRDCPRAIRALGARAGVPTDAG